MALRSLTRSSPSVIGVSIRKKGLERLDVNETRLKSQCLAHEVGHARFISVTITSAGTLTVHSPVQGCVDGSASD